MRIIILIIQAFLVESMYVRNVIEFNNRLVIKTVWTFSLTSLELFISSVSLSEQKVSFISN